LAHWAGVEARAGHRAESIGRPDEPRWWPTRPRRTSASMTAPTGRSTRAHP
jgi:hypothetical protein